MVSITENVMRLKSMYSLGKRLNLFCNIKLLVLIVEQYKLKNQSSISISKT